MNFSWLTGHIDGFWEFLIFGIGSLVVSLAILWGFFRRRGYFEGSGD